MDTIKMDAEANMEFTRTTGLANMVYDKFQTSKNQRVLQEQVWIEAMQNFNGEYGPSVTFREGGSSIFVNITQMKTMAAYTRLMAVMFGPGGYPWNIEPTPHPAMVQTGMTMQAAEVAPETSPELREMIIAARKAKDGMKNRIDDDLVESLWEEKCSRGLLDLCSLGTMIFKGPIAAPPKPKKWIKVQDDSISVMDRIKGALGMKTVQTEKFVLAHDPMDEYRANIDWLSPFEFYPDPGAYSDSDMMWAIQRHVLNKAQLVELANGKGFDPEEIRNALDSQPDGNWHAEPWEGFLNTINRRAQSVYLSKRYTVLEFWGYLSGYELKMAGVDGIEDDHAMYLANVWACGNFCIKIAISGNQTKKIPFFVVPYEKVPYKIWGRGVPEKMADPQAVINASARAMVENMGMAAGPQVIYDVNRVMPGTKVDQIVPWGIWATKNIEGIQNPPVQFQKIDPILNELQTIMGIFRNFVQEVTSLPDMTSGLPGAQQHNRTMGGMSMLFGAADSYTRSVVANIDNYLTKPMIRALYDWEMQYCPDMSIKGDMTVKASGVQGLMAKELTTQRLTEFMQAAGQIPGAMDYVNMQEVMREIFRSLDVINEAVILSDQEVEQKRQIQAQQQLQQQAAQAQATNLPKPKAETTRNDAILQILERMQPTDPIYPIMFAKLLDGYNELDPMSIAALDIMKTRIIAENRSFSNEQEIKMLSQDIEMEKKLVEAMNSANEQKQGPPPEAPVAPEQAAQVPPPEPQSPVNVHLHMPKQETKKSPIKFTRDEHGKIIGAEPI